MESSGNVQMSGLRGQWLEGREVFLRDGKSAHEFLKRVNGGGEHLLALEIGEEMLAGGGVEDDVPLRQQVARALAVMGSSDEARRILEEIPLGRSDDGETLGLLARVWKDLALATEEVEEVRRCYAEARRFYALGYEAAVAAGDPGGAEYCGINAAAMSVMLGESDEAGQYAGKAAAHAEGDDGYYGIATRAEAALILGDDEEADRLYRMASLLGEKEKRWADLASTRKQCRSLCHILHGKRDRFDGCFATGNVGVFSGELYGGSACPEGVILESVKRRVRRWLAEHEIRHVFSGVRDGWEKVMLEVASDEGAEIHLILPHAAYHAEGCEGFWVGAASVTVLSNQAIPEDSGERLFVEKMVAARGRLLASHLGVGMKALLVADQTETTAAGTWDELNLERHVIHPNEEVPDGIPEKDVISAPVPFPQALGGLKTKQPVLAILHLVFHGYEVMGSKGQADFRRKALEAMALRVAAMNLPPLMILGMGGAYRFAFSGVYAAAEAAMSFAEVLMEEAPFAMCLHAGPVSMEVNPLLHIYEATGETVSRCGVICERLPGGSVCATETFAALAALEAVRVFRFEHSGKIECNGMADRLFRLQTIGRK